MLAIEVLFLASRYTTTFVTSVGIGADSEGIVARGTVTFVDIVANCTGSTGESVAEAVQTFAGVGSVAIFTMRVIMARFVKAFVNVSTDMAVLTIQKTVLTSA